MLLKELMHCAPENQKIQLDGDGITASVCSDAETLTNVLSEDVQKMYVTDVEALNNVLHVWIQTTPPEE